MIYMQPVKHFKISNIKVFIIFLAYAVMRKEKSRY